MKKAAGSPLQSSPSVATMPITWGNETSGIGIARRQFPKRCNNADHVGGQALSCSGHFRPESSLLGKRRWNVHDLIIARQVRKRVPAVCVVGYTSPDSEILFFATAS